MARQLEILLHLRYTEYDRDSQGEKLEIVGRVCEVHLTLDRPTFDRTELPFGIALW